MHRSDAADIFSSEKKSKSHDELTAPLFEEIGRLTMDIKWLEKKALSLPIKVLRQWIAPDPKYSIRRQCRLAGVSRSVIYYKPAAESDENLALMRLIDEQYLRHPDYGSPRMTDWLKTQGQQANHKRVERLMKLMGLQAITPGPHTSRPNPAHPVFPYLLKGVAVERQNQVWSADITYIPMRRGFLYLVAVIDWWSRYVLAWELSNSMDSSFCVDALQKALRIASPEIFNTDQGSQFTSREFTGVLQENGIAISMDGKGRALDNVFVACSEVTQSLNNPTCLP